MVMVREWRHLKMLKRAGRGHDPAGVRDTRQGSLAIICPACPHHNINLLPGWDTVPERDRYVHTISFTPALLWKLTSCEADGSIA